MRKFFCSVLILLLAGTYMISEGGAEIESEIDHDLEFSHSSFLGWSTENHAGQSVSIAGDVNGDGFDDILIGSYGYTDGSDMIGMVYLLLGNEDGWNRNIPLYHYADASFYGEYHNDYAGYSLSGAGDVNDDGYDDFLIGAHLNDEGGVYGGQVYLFFGKESGWSRFTNLSSADASFIGSAYQGLGKGLSGLGDVNGDGIDDFAIGAPNGYSYNGVTYVFFGNSGGWQMDMNMTNADVYYTGGYNNKLGETLTEVGDVNNDGYNDILIGSYDLTYGKAYLVLGRSSNWSSGSISSKGLMFYSNEYNSGAGFVAGPGDVNGDGYDDILIGAPHSDPKGDSSAGQTYLIFGKESGWSGTRYLSDSDASFTGEGSSQNSGYAVSKAGDMNGDGYADFVIGAWGNDQAGEDAGRTYVVLGKSGGWRMGFNLANADDYFTGENADDRSGYSVSGGGDVNGDGYDEVLIGAPNYEYSTTNNIGKAYLVYFYDQRTKTPDKPEFKLSGEGDYISISWRPISHYSPFYYNIYRSEDGSTYNKIATLDEDILQHQDLDVVIGNTYSYYITTSTHEGFESRASPPICVNNLPDIDRDGVGDPFDEDKDGDGIPNGLDPNPGIKDGNTWGRSDVDLGNYEIGFKGEGEYQNCGYSVSGAGDVNGDGFDDFLIGSQQGDDPHGSSRVGKVYLMCGSGSMEFDTNLSNCSASFIGENYYDRAGSSLSGAGDVNGDGYDDFVIGAWGNDDGGSSAGKVYLIFGKQTGWEKNMSLSEADASFIGETSGSYAGLSLSGGGDVNGDGYADFMVGAYGNNEGGTSSGQTYLVLGKFSKWSLDTELTDADASFIGESSSDLSGISVSVGGDVNGDGLDDILIGARGNGKGGSNSGQTYLVFGKKSGWSMDVGLNRSDGSFFGEKENDRSGNSVSIPGDVNGDGFDDIVIGAYGNCEGDNSAGQTYLLFGKENGWDMYTNLSHSDASFIGEEYGDLSGYRVSSGGDINRDGYNDILIGAYANDDNGVNAGKTYVILGKRSPWKMDTDLSMADSSFHGEVGDDRSGFAVSSAGDVNRDGFDEILIGAYGNDDMGSGSGKAYLLHREISEQVVDFKLGLNPEGTIDLEWGASVRSPLFFGIYRGSDRDSLFRLANSTGTDFEDIEVDPGRDYHYSVVVTCPLGGESEIVNIFGIVADSDTDGDGLGNLIDRDDDNDTIPDESDAFPLDSTEYLDTDGDGIGNGADTDDDNDGIMDPWDTWPLRPLNDMESSLDDLLTMDTTLTDILDEMDQLQSSLSHLGSDMYEMERNLSGEISHVGMMIEGMNTSILLELANILSGIERTDSSLRGLVESMWIDLNSTSSSDRGAIVGMIDTMWGGMNRTVDGMNNSMIWRLDEMGSSIENDTENLRDYIELRMDQLRIYLELINSTIHHHLDQIRSDLAGFDERTETELGNLSSYLIELNGTTTDEHGEILSALNATQDLLSSYKEMTLGEIREGLGGIHDYLVGFNSSVSVRKAEIISGLIAELDTLNSSVTSHINSIESSMSTRDELEEIEESILKLKEDVESNGKRSDENDSSLKLLITILIVLVIVLIGLQVFITVKSLKGEKEEFLE